MKKRWDVAVAGEIFADHIFSGFDRWPRPGEEIFTHDYVREVGGGAAITACALGRLERTTALFAVAGREDAWIGRRLRECGVHLENFHLVDEGTAVTISLSTREDRSFFTWPGANRRLAAYLEDANVVKRLAMARHVHFALAPERNLVERIFPRLKAEGCSLSIDPGHHPAWLQARENWRTCAEVDFFLPNAAEGRLMTGAEDPEAILHALKSADIHGTVLKLGAEGAAACAENRVLHVRPPAVDAVDTTGAGDAFDAGLIDASLDAHPLATAMERGCLCGALSTRQAGAIQALPGRKELSQHHAQTRQS